MTNQDYTEINNDNNREVAYMLNNNSLAVADAGSNFNPFYIHREKNIESVRTWLNEEKQAEFEALTGITTPTVAELKALSETADGETKTVGKGKTKKP